MWWCVGWAIRLPAWSSSPRSPPTHTAADLSVGDAVNQERTHREATPGAPRSAGAGERACRTVGCVVCHALCWFGFGSRFGAGGRRTWMRGGGRRRRTWEFPCAWASVPLSCVCVRVGAVSALVLRRAQFGRRLRGRNRRRRTPPQEGEKKAATAQARPTRQTQPTTHETTPSRPARCVGTDARACAIAALALCRAPIHRAFSASGCRGISPKGRRLTLGRPLFSLRACATLRSLWLALACSRSLSLSLQVLGRFERFADAAAARADSRRRTNTHRRYSTTTTTGGRAQSRRPRLRHGSGEGRDAKARLCCCCCC